MSINENELSKLFAEPRLDVKAFAFAAEAKLMAPHDFIEGLGLLGIRKVKRGKVTSFVRKVRRLVKEVDIDEIQDIVKNHCLEHEPEKLASILNNSKKLFEIRNLKSVAILDDNFLKDSKDSCYLIFTSCVWEITAEEIKIIPIGELSNNIWAHEVIDKIDGSHLDMSTIGMYGNLISLSQDEKSSRITPVETALGYLIHRHRSPHLNFAIVLIDEKPSTTGANGRNSKSLYFEAIGYVRPISIIHGKDYNPNSAFKNQSIDKNANVVVYDDVTENFPVTVLYNTLTLGIQIEKKYEQAIVLNRADSPRIGITTNHPLDLSGGSSDARFLVYPVNHYFSAKHKPIDEFGCILFDEWEKDEWVRFYSYIARCVQTYLREGLIKGPKLDFSELIAAIKTSEAFCEWCDDFFYEEHPIFSRWTSSVRLYEDIPIKLEMSADSRVKKKALVLYFESKGFTLLHSKEKIGPDGKRRWCFKAVPKN